MDPTLYARAIKSILDLLFRKRETPLSTHLLEQGLTQLSDPFELCNAVRSFDGLAIGHDPYKEYYESLQPTCYSVETTRAVLHDDFSSTFTITSSVCSSCASAGLPCTHFVAPHRESVARENHGEIIELDDVFDEAELLHPLPASVTANIVIESTYSISAVAVAQVRKADRLFQADHLISCTTSSSCVCEPYSPLTELRLPPSSAATAVSPPAFKTDIAFISGNRCPSQFPIVIDANGENFVGYCGACSFELPKCRVECDGYTYDTGILVKGDVAVPFPRFFTAGIPYANRNTLHSGAFAEDSVYVFDRGKSYDHWILLHYGNNVYFLPYSARNYGYVLSL